MSGRFIDALSKAPSLTTLSLSSFWNINTLEPLSWSASLREIHYSGSFDKELMQRLLEELDETGRFAGLFKYYKPIEHNWCVCIIYRLLTCSTNAFSPDRK